MIKKAKNEPSRVDQLVAKAGEKAREAGVEIEPEEFTLEWYRVEWPARKRIFLEREIKIRNAFERNKSVPFVLNDAQVELLEASIEASADTSLEDFTLKCRRLGISTYYCADYFADAIMESGHHVRIVAQDADTLRSLMDSIKGMYEGLRPEIRPASKYNSVYDLALNDESKGVTGSRVSVSAVSPGHEEKGRGDTITRLHMTEIPFWNGNPEIAAVALSDAAKGGKISGESTAKGVGDWFHKKYTQGKRKEGGIRSHFFEWWWNSNYKKGPAVFVEAPEGVYLVTSADRLSQLDDEEKKALLITDYTDEVRLATNLPLQSEFNCAQKILDFLKIKGHVSSSSTWLCQEVAERLMWRRQEIAKKGAKKFRVEYPENDIDPFAQTGGTVFDQQYTNPLAQRRDAEKGHQYIVYLDPSMGIEGADPAAVVVIDYMTGEQVYSWTGYEKQDSQGARCCELSDKYNGAEIGIESNMGEAAILECERLGYGHRLYRYIDAQTQRDVDEGKVSMMDAIDHARPGLPMTDRLKRLSIGLLEKAWRLGDFKACSENLCEEAKVFVQNGNKMEAKSGYHDDEIMATAGAWFIVVSNPVASVDFMASGKKLPSASTRAF